MFVTLSSFPLTSNILEVIFLCLLSKNRLAVAQGNGEAVWWNPKTC